MGKEVKSKPYKSNPSAAEQLTARDARQDFVVDYVRRLLPSEAEALKRQVLDNTPESFRKSAAGLAVDDPRMAAAIYHVRHPMIWSKRDG